MQLIHRDQVYKQDHWFLIIRLKRFGYIRCDIIVSFLPRDAMRKRGLCCRPVSLRLSVRLSRWCVLSRRLKMSDFFDGPLAHHSSFLTISTDTQFL